MSDLLQAGAAWLAAQMKASGAVAVTYRRGTYSVALQATLGSQMLRVTDRLGNTRVERPDCDFLFTAADLVLNGVAATPQDGDLIDVSGDRFEVMPVNGGREPSWRYADAHKTILRVHTQFTGTV